MRPNAKMAGNCRQALQWFSEFPEARHLGEQWMLRFARTVTHDKTFATVARLSEWHEAHEHYRGTPGFFAVGDAGPSAERVAWDLLGGDAGVEWARSALEAIPVDEEFVVSDTIDRLEREADAREALVAAGARVEMAAADWYSPEVYESLGGRPPEWGGVVVVEGMMTDDNRLIREGAIRWRLLPFSLRTQPADIGRHDGAVPVGQFTGLRRSTPDEVRELVGVDLPAGAVPIWAHGLFDVGDVARTARQQIGDGVKMGVSVDMVDVELALPDDPMDVERVMTGELPLVITGAKIAGATLVDIPAFEMARLRILGDLPQDAGEVEALVASGGRGLTLSAVMPLEWVASAPVVELAETEVCDEFDADADDEVCARCGHPAADHAGYKKKKMAADEPCDDEVLVAAGAPRPPAAWFEVGVYTGVRPVQIEEPDSAGLRQIHGYVAAWGSCHIGFAGRCVDVPRGLDYDSYQGDRVPGSVQCSDGATLKAGPVVMDTVHPSLKASASDAAAHYAHTGSLIAQVRLYEDQHGLQMRGWVLPGVSDADMARLRASDYSPDWRPRATGRGGRGVVAVLAVPVSGFNLGLVASGGEADGPVEDLAIIGSSWTPHTAALAARKVDVVTRLGFTPDERLVALAASVEPPEVSARKDRVAARLGLGGCSCGCEASG